MAAVLALAGSWPSGASALSSTCLWRGVSEAQRERMFADYRINGMRARPEMPDYAYLRNCGANELNIQRTARLFAGTFLELASVLVLDERYGVAPEAVREAYEGIDPGDRARLPAAVIGIWSGQGDAVAPELVMRPLVDMEAGLKTPEEARVHLYAYLVGRILREAHETARDQAGLSPRPSGIAVDALG